MGRRSINTTKSGKYMNPTDQARKEARKKELKKNKRQRQMVRAAVLKMKDPNQILEELQKIDEMEFNVLQPSPLNEKVLKEKRKKLRETFDRVLKMYDKDEPEKWVDLKRQEMEYEKRRAHLISYYESVKHAQSVQLDDIPLPAIQVPDHLYGYMPSQIPLPDDPGHPNAPKPILKKDSVYKEKPSGIEPPGVPPGPPVDYTKLLQDIHGDKRDREKKSLRFADMNDEGPPGETIAQTNGIHNPEHMDGDAMDDSEHAPVPPAAPKPTSLQQRMLALSGQNIDDFMKEMEEVHKKRERDRAADLTARLSALKRPAGGVHHPLGAAGSDSDSDGDHHEHHEHLAHLDHLDHHDHLDHLDLQLEPPGAEVRHLPPPLMPPGFRPPMPAPRLLRPPGPPPGAPPRLLRPLAPPPPPKQMPPVSVLTAAPILITKKDGAQGATITAKPQIRNLSADVTRFVPSALRVKREDKKTKSTIKSTIPRQTDIPKQVPSKDDAYMQFMKEMEGLL